MLPYIFFLFGVAVLTIALMLQRRIKDMREDIRAQEREKKAMITMLDRVGTSLTGHLDIYAALNIIADYIVKAAEADAGAIFLLDEKKNALKAEVVCGMFPPMSATLSESTEKILTKKKYLAQRVKAAEIPMGEGVIGMVAKNGQALLIADCENDARMPKLALDFLTLSSLMAVPLRARGKVLGVFAVTNKHNGEAFDDQDANLLQALADQAAVTVDLVTLIDELTEKQRIVQELRVAHDFQRMLLPEKCPEVAGFEVEAYCCAAEELGGDFYDFISLEEGRVGVVIADVSGKGIPAALIMAMTLSTLRAEARLSNSPAEVMKQVNRRVYPATQAHVFVTMIYGVLDPKQQTFRFVRAGHEPVLICRPGSTEISQQTPHGIALGMVPPEIFDLVKEEEIKFEPGDIGVLYTDGVTEAMDSANTEYGHERFFQSLRDSMAASGREIVKSVADDIESFRRDAPQHDDITMVVIRTQGSESSA